MIETPKPDGVILVVDASSLDRNLYLATQILEFGLPSVIALTMVDVAKTRGISIDLEKLSRAIGCPVVAVNAPQGEGLQELKATLHKRLHHPATPLLLEFPPEFVSAVDALHLKLADIGVTLGYTPTRPEALRLIVDAAGPLFEEAHEAGGSAFEEEFAKLRTQACGGKSAALIEAQARYGRIAAWTREARTQTQVEGRTLTDRIDSVLTHRLWGTLVFILVMGVIFQSIYTWASPLMDLIESGTGWVGDLVGSNMEDGPLKGLIVDGVIGGAGGVLVFLPQILILFLFIAILEDLGYMSRAAFLMDRLMSRFGLTGRSFIPLLSQLRLRDSRHHGCARDRGPQHTPDHDFSGPVHVMQRALAGLHGHDCRVRTQRETARLHFGAGFNTCSRCTGWACWPLFPRRSC